MCNKCESSKKEHLFTINGKKGFCTVKVDWDDSSFHVHFFGETKPTIFSRPTKSEAVALACQLVQQGHNKREHISTISGLFCGVN